MDNVYNINGLPFWSEREILYRSQAEAMFALEIREMLLAINPRWAFHRIEAPLLTPTNLLNPNYTADDIWMQAAEEGETPLALRPETTPGSYEAARAMLANSSAQPPLVVWQSGKSFRREQDQVSKNMRLKEFYQQEFQCVFTADTFDDYQERVLEPVRAMIERVVGVEARLVESDRLPSYSMRTMDVEVKTPHKWLELCSISKRTDFPDQAVFQTKKGVVTKDLLVLEIAIGLDRCVHAHFER